MIQVTITYSCGGCDAEDHGPEGWVVYDPYTLVTYCGECWESIENGTCDD